MLTLVPCQALTQLQAEIDNATQLVKSNSEQTAIDLETSTAAKKRLETAFEVDREKLSSYLDEQGHDCNHVQLSLSNRASYTMGDGRWGSVALAAHTKLPLVVTRIPLSRTGSYLTRAPPIPS